MLKHPRTVQLDEDPNLSEAIDGVASDGDPRLIVRDGQTVAVLVSPGDYAATDIWADYDAKRAKEAFAELRGAFEGVDTNQLKRDLRAARGQDSAGRHD